MPYVSKHCPCCGRKLPKEKEEIDPLNVPMSDFHVRCVKCLWPVAKNIITENGICRVCTGKP